MSAPAVGSIDNRDVVLFREIKFNVSNDREAPLLFIYPKKLTDYFDIQLLQLRNTLQMGFVKTQESDIDFDIVASKLKLFCNLFYPYISVIIGDLDIELTLEQNLNQRIPKHIIFEETENRLNIGLESLKNDNTLLDGFGQVVNWLDFAEGQNQSGFCSLRDSVFHINVDRAYEICTERYPDIEFTVVDGKNVMARNKKNLAIFKGFVPDLLTRVRRVFLEKRTSTH